MAAQPGRTIVSPRTKTNVVFQFAHSTQSPPNRPLPTLPTARPISTRDLTRSPRHHHPEQISSSSSASSSSASSHKAQFSAPTTATDEHVIPRSIRQQPPPDSGYSSAPETTQNRHHHQTQSMSFRIKGFGRRSRARGARPVNTVAPKSTSPPRQRDTPGLQPQHSAPAPHPHNPPRSVPTTRVEAVTSSRHEHSATATIHIGDIPTQSEPLLGGPIGPLETKRAHTERLDRIPRRIENLDLPGRKPVSRTTSREYDEAQLRPKARMGDETRWKRGTLIGVGSFGKVYMAMNIETGELLAVKQIPTINMSETSLQQLENEVSIMRTLSHPHIVALYGIQQTDEHLNILMEYVPGKSLDTMYKQFGPLEESTVQKFLRQCVDGLAFAHRNYVIHRDIKGKNILVDSKGVIKLADFGSAKILDATMATELQPSIGYQYTPLWTAPEVMLGNYDEKVDVWSIGCVLIEICTAEAPWHECDFKNPFSALYHIGNTDAIPRWPETLSESCQDFLRCCLVRDPRDRWSAARLLEHTFLQNVYIPALHG